jgi:hypothetical protein
MLAWRESLAQPVTAAAAAAAAVYKGKINHQNCLSIACTTQI